MAGSSYRSNLAAPDLEPCFRHVVSRPMAHSMGHNVLSDVEHYPECGFWTHDEAAILYHVASAVGGEWADIGAHTGWTACHQAAAGCRVAAVDNMYAVESFRRRAEENIAAAGLESRIELFGAISREFFAAQTRRFDGVVIDGDHEPPVPLEDARDALERLKPRGVILFHDFIGKPVRDGVRWLLENGLRARIYWTPHVVAVCWRGQFHPPPHRPDPAVDWPAVRSAMTDFDFALTE